MKGEFWCTSLVFPVERHFTGQQLCEAIRQYAVNQSGYLAKVALRNWELRFHQFSKFYLVGDLSALFYCFEIWLRMPNNQPSLQSPADNEPVNDAGLSTENLAQTPIQPATKRFRVVVAFLCFVFLVYLASLTWSRK